MKLSIIRPFINCGTLEDVHKIGGTSTSFAEILISEKEEDDISFDEIRIKNFLEI